MPTIVGILIFMISENSMLSWDEHEKSFITSGPGAYRWFRVLGKLLGHEILTSQMQYLADYNVSRSMVPLL